jgi:phospholipid-transporting ATPase
LICHAESLGGQNRKLKSERNVDLNLKALLRKGLVDMERLAAHEFFLTLAACNTVIPMMTTSSASSAQDHETEAINYQGESPDEQALVTAASAYGYTLIERTTGHILVDINGEKTR